MKKIILSSILSLTILLSNAQTKQDRTVSSFAKIKASTAVNVIITQVNPTSMGTESINNIKLEGDEDQVNKIKTEVKDGVLEIYSVDPKDDNDVKVYVNHTGLNGIDVSGAASVKSTNQLSIDKLILNSSGAGSVKIQLAAKEVSITGTGAGNFNLSGSTDKLSVDVSGACDLKAYNLATENTVVSATGAATAKINAKKSLEAKASGAGTIKYSGDPANKNIEVSGAGTVKKYDGGMLSVEMSYDNDAQADSLRKTKSLKHRYHDDSYNFWNGIQLGVNGLMTSENSTSIPAPYDYLSLNYGKSIGCAANILEHDFHLYQNHLNLVTGMGFEFVYNNFKQPIRLDPNAKGIAFSYDSISSYKKNKLVQTYINIPLMLVYNSKNTDFDHSFHIAVGVIGGYKLSSWVKQVYTNDGNRYKMIRKDDYNLNPFKLSATARVGYGGISLFADYSLTPLFEKTIGPVLHPFTIGFTFNM